jgi:hypothetical protein
MTDPSAPPDALAEAAALIRDVGLSAERARRYRALATSVAAPAFDRNLEIGSTIRRAGRDPGAEPSTIAVAIAELRDLLARTEAAVAAIHLDPSYRDAATAFRRGEVTRVASLATAIFTDVEPLRCSGTVAWEVPVAGERRAERFASPETCVARIAAVQRDGLRATGTTSGFGGDETITPILLTTDPDGADSPLVLAYDARSLPGPLCGLAGSAIALFYGRRLRAPFIVRAATTVSDEWWNVRPDAYAEWRAELAPLLQRAGLTLATD